MPVGTVDYRERLRGPGTQDVLGMILRGIAGGPAPSAEPTLDPEGAAAVRQLGTPPLRPDEQAAIADRKARAAHRQIIGGAVPQSIYGDSSFGVGSTWPPRPANKPPSREQLEAISPTMAGQAPRSSMGELPPSSGVPYSRRLAAKGVRSANLQDVQAETGKINEEYQKIAGFIEQDAARDLGPDLARTIVPQMFPEAGNPRERLEWARRTAQEIKAARKAGYSYWQGGMESGAGARGY